MKLNICAFLFSRSEKLSQTNHLGLAVPKIFHYSIITQYSPGVDLYIVKLIICMPLETDLKMWKI